MTIGEIIVLCREYLADFPDPRITVRPAGDHSTAPDQHSTWRFLSQMEYESRDELDQILQSNILDMREFDLTPTQVFFVRIRLQGAIYNLTLLLQTLNEDEDLVHATPHRSYSFEWALVRYWNACRHSFLSRVARAIAAGMTDPLDKIPSEDPPWMDPMKKR